MGGQVGRRYIYIWQVAGAVRRWRLEGWNGNLSSVPWLDHFLCFVCLVFVFVCLFARLLVWLSLIVDLFLLASFAYVSLGCCCCCCCVLLLLLLLLLLLVVVVLAKAISLPKKGYPIFLKKGATLFLTLKPQNRAKTLMMMMMLLMMMMMMLMMMMMMILMIMIELTPLRWTQSPSLICAPASSQVWWWQTTSHPWQRCPIPA